MEITTYYMKENPCYKQAKKMTPKGIVVHSSGCNNPNIARYVEPDDGIIGKNKYGNGWNKSSANKCVHAFIGKDKHGVVRCYNTLPWDYKPWGCGGGSKGSYNNSHIQFEVLEDDMKDPSYFKAAWEMAEELCAFLCKKYNLDVSTIVSHQEAHKLGYASDHDDPSRWFKAHNYTMDVFRSKVARIVSNAKPSAWDVDVPSKGNNAVQAILEPYMVVCTPNDTLNVRKKSVYTSDRVTALEDGSVVAIAEHATNGWKRVKFGSGTTYITGWVNGSFLRKPNIENNIEKVTNTPKDVLNIRVNPHYTGRLVGSIPDKSTVTVCEKWPNGWVMVIYKDMVGWVNSAYLKETKT